MKAKLSILTFPQRWQANRLIVRALVIPRNFDPTKANEIAMGTPAFCDAVMDLQARFISNAEKNLSILEADKKFAFSGLKMPTGTRELFNEMATRLGGIKSTQRLEKAENFHRTRKYLPRSYQDSFNFSLKNKDAVIDDTYRCAIRDKGGFDPAFKSSENSLSWGKVFAHCLRQPALAERVGFIYEASLAIDAADLKNGGWLYVDLGDASSYKAAMNMDQALVKRYGARIPKLIKDKDRSVFAAIQFPVLINASPNPLNEDDVLTPSNMDELLIEATQYDDGFCKIVHANQPVSSDLLLEEEDKELPVITDAGIRLGWDDEQILTWINRQMKPDPTLPNNRRTDAPMGIMQYRVDVRLASTIAPNPNAWVPLCRVKNKLELKLGTTTIDKINAERELGIEVYPAQLDARKQEPFWLPQYFADFIGNNIVLPDNDAIDIFKKAENNIVDNGKVKRVNKNNQYSAAGMDGFKLLYGNKYEFRVRLADVSGGGPAISDKRIYAAPMPQALCDFRRAVQPQPVRLTNNIPARDDVYFTDTSLKMRRPLLGYPAVLFTGKYANPVELLKADSTLAVTERREVGLADPDVDAVEVLIEIKALEMDTLLRYNTESQDSYAKLYITKRKFPVDFKGELTIPITFADVPVLKFEESKNLGDLNFPGLTDDIDARTDIVLPTSRDIRITLRPTLAKQENYYAKGTSLPLTGKPVILITRKASNDERALFHETADVDRIRAVWLQPDSDTYLKATIGEIVVENYQPSNTSSIMKRLADSMDQGIKVIEAKGMSLVAKDGNRVQFGASRLIRNNLSPDSTSITISTKSDLLNQWIVPITFMLNRDWTWDGAKPVSFKIFRKTKMVGAGKSQVQRNAIAYGDEELVGDIEMKQTINVQALFDADRTKTYLCFLDAVEPKDSGQNRHPQEMMVEYRVQAQFKSLPSPAAAVTKDLDTILSLHLPITNKPAQVPKIVSAGIAQSKYVTDEVYSSTEPRKRFLWLEFAEGVKNPNDTYFVRMLAYSPDPLLGRWDNDMMKAPEEPSLPVNPEPIRITSPNHVDDRTGLNAMQELTKADDSDTHYLVPLPPGIHTSSAELFGFFTYELRVGHKIGWSTAQARFGSALRTTGVQHPPPQLFCTIKRNEKHIMVNAPFAQTVFNGANVTMNPPRTQLWALLYAQVKRADDKAYRNILLDDQLFIRKRQKTNAAGLAIIQSNTDAVQYGITGWRNKDVEAMLEQLGLPVDSNLSVLVVEMLPTYEKFFSRTDDRGSSTTVAGTSVNRNAKEDLGMEVQTFKRRVVESGRAAGKIQEKIEQDRQTKLEEGFINEANRNETVRPLSDQLGSERILRTSTLVAVPEICCTE